MKIDRRFSLVFIAIACVCGSIIGTSINYFYLPLTALILASIALVLCIIFKRDLLFPIVFCFFFLCIFLSNLKLLNPKIEIGNARVSGRIVSNLRDKDEQKLAFFLRDISIDGKSVPYGAYCSLFRSELNKENIAVGDRIAFEASISFPNAEFRSRGFNFKYYLKQNNLDLIIYNIKKIKLIDKQNGFYLNDHYLRNNIKNSLSRVLGSDAATFAMALAFGDKQGFDYEQRESYNKLGIAHIFAASGLHISIIIALLVSLLDRIRLPKRINLIISFIAISIYCFITGYSPSGLRSYLIFSIFLCTQFFNRRLDIIHASLLALIITLLINPIYVFSLSFILSYCVYFGIILFSDRLYRFVVRNRITDLTAYRYRHILFIFRLFCASLVAQIFSIVPLIYFFSYFNPLSILINIVLIPLIMVLLPCIIVLCIISFIPIISNLLGYFCLSLIYFIKWGVGLININTRISIAPELFNPTALVCIVLLFITIFYSKKYLNIYKKLFLSFILCSAIIFSYYITFSPSVSYVQLNVGQADAAVIEADGQVAVIDTGENASELISYLNNKNLNIDHLFISHLDFDHVGGALNLMENHIKIKNVYFAYGADVSKTKNKYIMNALKKYADSYHFLKKGDLIDMGKVKFNVLFPLNVKPLKNRDANDGSLVTSIKILNTYLLSTGDLGSPFEHYTAFNSDILKLGHHGSQTSSHKDFLKSVAPSVGIIPCGAYNKVIPHDRVLKDLKDLKIPYYRSDKNGDVQILFSERGYKLIPSQAGIIYE